MRRLSDQYLACLKSGFLSPLTEYVKQDPDLNLEIRDGYINVYYKGNALLKLVETGSGYKAAVHEKFLVGIAISLDFTDRTIAQFIEAIPRIKENIIRHSKRSLEVEYEQMIIRANNFEHRNNTEYFIVDRQYAAQDSRFDLTGIFWERNHRQRYQEVPVCLMEIKFALNADIKEVHLQLERYYEYIKPHAAEVAQELEGIFRQKLDLGLYNQAERLEALKTLTFSRDIEQFQFILILVDYNPNSTALNLDSIASLPFANQVKIFFSGFAMWQQNVKPIASHGE